MLIKGLLDLIYYVLDLVLFIELPPLSDSIDLFLQEALGYIFFGLNVLCSFIGSSALDFLFLVLYVVISANLFYMAWSTVFWILRKIPMLGIKE